MAVLLVFLIIAVWGCSGTEPKERRLAADREVYDAIAERNVDPRWHSEDFSIDMDPRSRYFDPYDPDNSPMPEDDPASHQYMRLVAGMKGWKHWDDNGHRKELENPAWRQALAEYVELETDGSVRLNVETALLLAYIHSPSHQSQLETLYSSALDVTAERFRLDAQFFGGYDARFAHAQSPRSNELTVGQTTAGDPALQGKRKFAGAGELVVGFANSFVTEFSGNDTTFSSSIANFSLVQPLLRGAGRDIALEQLTKVERVLLANLRAYHQYRQGFYTEVTIGELGVAGPQRGGRGTNITAFSGQGGVAGYIGLLQQLQQVRNTKDSLGLQERTLLQLEAHYKGGMISLVQVDQFRQSIQNERSSLLQSQSSFELALDRYKTGTLGLPPDMPINLDDSMIRQFQLIADKATELEEEIIGLQERLGELSDDIGNLRPDVSIEKIGQIITDSSELIEPVQNLLNNVQPDLDRMEKLVPVRERAMTDAQKIEFRRDRERLGRELADSKQECEKAKAVLEKLRSDLLKKTREGALRDITSWVRDLLGLVQRASLVQARARLEMVTIETIQLDSADAFGIALANRMDLMNGRAALVDSWRLIQVNADALQSQLNVTVDGDLATTRNNPVSFRGSTANVRLGVEFDAPFTRLLERNNYRQSLIDYQRSRRDFIRSHDSLHLGLRELLRQIEQLRMDLEIQRNAVAIAIRRVDMTRSAFYEPPPPVLPGQRAPQFGPTAATNFLSSLTSLRNTQNSFMSVWLNYYAARMRLARELGVMKLDDDGAWIDDIVPGIGIENDPNSGVSPETEAPLPPAVRPEWIELSERLVEETDESKPMNVGTSGDLFADDEVELSQTTNRAARNQAGLTDPGAGKEELVTETDHVD